MNNPNFVELCLKLIEAKIDKGSSDDWTHKIFITLSEDISNKTGIYISISSLKRLYGKVKYESSPQKETLNALAKYLDYKSWNDFQEKHQPLNSISNEKAKKTLKKQRILLILIPIFFAFFTIYLMIKTSNSNYEEIVFKIKKIEGEAPFNLVVNYDISMLDDNENAYINFDDFSTPNHKIKELLPRNKNTITHTYLYGDLGKVKLYIGDSLVREIPVLIKTKGWQNVIALYEENKYFSLVDKENGIYENKLFIRPSIVAANGIDTIRDYYFKNRWVAPLNSNSPDNFIYETKIRNTYNLGGNNCPEVDMSVLCESGEFKFKIFNSGCSGSHTLNQFGNIMLDGNYSDLTTFGQDLNNWKTIRMEVKNKHVDIFCNNKLIFDTSYTEPCGKLFGVLFGMKRSAEVDYVRLMQFNGKPIFVDEFNTLK